MQKHKMTSSDELLAYVEVLTRQRDSSLVRLSAMQSLLMLIRPESIRLFDVMKKGDRYSVILAAWNEGALLHFSDPLVTEDKFEQIAADSLLEKSLVKGGGYFCGIQGSGYVCCIPVLMDDEPVSVFEIQGKEPFSAEQIAMASGMVSVYRNYLGLLEDSQRDTLTGLLNRKTFDSGFSVFLTSALRSDDPQHNDRRSHKEGSHWLAVVDIDHFKRVNDTFGHLYGDEVLILMANLMRSSFRQADRLYRFGGEEFVVLMRDVDFADVKKKLDDFRGKVAQHVFPQVGQVTISIGFTSVVSTSTPAMVLGEADEALYYAKGHGRNQVRCYGELVEQKLLTEKTVHTEADFF
ncbi:MAG: GGDEF domain-containing protein [Gallionella sp.]|nr:GGDEF domain-containing protein [Gallionella sp.]